MNKDYLSFLKTHKCPHCNHHHMQWRKNKVPTHEFPNGNWRGICKSCNGDIRVATDQVNMVAECVEGNL